ALARSQWQKLAQRQARLQQLDATYRAELPELHFPARSQPLMWPDFTADRRDAIVQHMAEAGIQLRPFWPPLHTQTAYRSDESFPGATEVSRTGCWLPASPGLKDEEVDDIVQTLKAFSCF
ncbi:MAG: DegT/DnrJ/EryC1/StrS family aminotransferase, partial [Verrucomicrobiota bacterium]